MIEPRIEIDSAEVTAAFNRLLQFARDPREGLDAVGRVMKTKVQLGFHTGTDPYGKPWAPLKSRSGQPLRDSDNLMGSFDYHVEGNSVEIGTNMPYAPTHQHGATIRPKSSDPKARLFFLVNGVPVFAREVKIPPREMLPLDGLPADWEEDIVDAIEGVIADQWAG
jgi:phage virion morphogenesis protein